MDSPRDGTAQGQFIIQNPAISLAARMGTAIGPLPLRQIVAAHTPRIVRNFVTHDHTEKMSCPQLFPSTTRGAELK